MQTRRLRIGSRRPSRAFRRARATGGDPLAASPGSVESAPWSRSRVLSFALARFQSCRRGLAELLVFAFAAMPLAVGGQLVPARPGDAENVTQSDLPEAKRTGLRASSIPKMASSICRPFSRILVDSCRSLSWSPSRPSITGAGASHCSCGRAEKRASKGGRAPTSPRWAALPRRTAPGARSR